MYEALGKVTIAPTVLTTIVRLTTLEQRGVRRLVPVPLKVRGFLPGGATEEGIRVEVTEAGVEVEVHIVADASENMLQLGSALQNNITRAITEMVGMAVARVDVHIDDVAMTPPEQEG